MRPFMLFGWLCLACMGATGQQLTALEYFFDRDPGFGAGIALPITPAADIDLNTTLSLSGLSTGLHTLYVRAQDNTGRWGQYHAQTFLLTNGISDGSTARIVALEYYIDEDPGYGQATPISVSATDQLSVDVTLDMASVPRGVHTLYMRALNEYGLWSHLASQAFLLHSGTGDGREPRLAGVEYFFGPDPGEGNGAFVPFSVADTLLVIPLNTVGPGIHLLGVRPKDSNGAYGHVTTSVVLVQPGAGDGKTPLITDLEYFFDEDPGYGQGINLDVPDVENLSLDLDLDLSWLPSGLHMLYLRARDLNGSWSHLNSTPVLKLDGVGNGTGPQLTALRYFFDKDDNTAWGSGTEISLSPGVMADTAFIIPTPELPLGNHTLAVQVRDQFGNWSLLGQKSFKQCSKLPPVAGFTPILYGKTVSFADDALRADQYIWNFGDGSPTSTMRYPKHDYARFGVYTITQIVINDCERDTVRHVVEIKGVESYTPTRSGNGADLLMTIYGAGFDANTQVRLIKGSRVLTPIQRNVPDLEHIYLVFDLHFAETGFYDLEVVIPGLPPFVFPQGFQVEGFRYPKAVAEVSGPSLVRTGRDNNYQLIVRNEGNVMAKGVSVWLLVPRDMTVEFERSEPFTKGITEFVYFEEETGKTYTVKASEVRHLIDTTRVPFVEIDTFRGDPYRGKAYSLLIPFIFPEDVAIVRFKGRSNSTGNQQFIAFANEINIWGSPSSPQWGEMSVMSGELALDALDVFAENSKNGLLEAFTKTAKVGKGHLGLAGQFFGNWSADWSNPGAAFDYAYGGGKLEEANWAAVKTAGEIVVDKGLGKVVDMNKAGIEQRFNDKASQITSRMLSEKSPALRNLDAEEFYRLIDKAALDTRQAGRVQDLWNLYKKIDDAATFDQRRQVVEKFLKDCPELKEAADELLKHTDDWLRNDKNKKKPIQSLNSFDPNLIYGPDGYGPDKWLRRETVFPFTVTFENADTASASAQIVRVVNPIDTSVFDLHTLRFSHVVVGDTTLSFVPGKQRYFLEYDMRPAQNLILRVNAWLNFELNTLNWEFLSLDPLTGDITNDPVAGFLPPNQQVPQGEGMVNYSIMLRKDVQHADTLRNYADIFFDDNAPIRTNTWQARIDDRAPQATMNPITVSQDTIMTLSWAGSDEGAGIQSYQVYLSVNGSDWYAIGGTENLSETMVGAPDSTYAFYVTAVDHVGLEEVQLPPLAETSITLRNDLKGPPDEWVWVYPNPTKNGITVELRVENTVPLQILDPTGRVARSIDISGAKNYLNLSDLKAGVYLFRFQNGKDIVTRKVVVMP